MAASPNVKGLTEEAGASFVSIGVMSDGGGNVIVNGKPVHVDPWGPLIDVAASLAAIQVAGLISNHSERVQIQKAAFAATGALMEKLGRSIGVTET
jgi:hypothetical protein